MNSLRFGLNSAFALYVFVTLYLTNVLTLKGFRFNCVQFGKCCLLAKEYDNDSCLTRLFVKAFRARKLL